MKTNPFNSGAKTILLIGILHFCFSSSVSEGAYTRPDSAASGGIRGKISKVSKPLVFAFAIPPSKPTSVYKATILSNGREFLFSGLPVNKYDLLLVCRDKFYEGLQLTMQANSLTARDLALIESTVTKSNPFFNLKKIHRCQGGTGREAKARAVLQEVRSLAITYVSGDVRSDIQIRSFKLIMMEDVGKIGWQMVSSREILRDEVGGPNKGILPHVYMPSLSGIRVVDSIKDIGLIKLLSK